MNFLIAAAAAVAALFIIEGIFLFFAGRLDPEAQRIKKQVKELSKIAETDVSLLTQGRPLSDVPWLNNFLLKVPLAKKMNDLIVQAGTSYSLGVFVLLSAVLALLGYVLILMATRDSLFSILGFVFAAIPYLLLLFKKSARIRKFESLLPEALDLLARSLKAGHALAGGLQMVAQEFPEPLGPEFARTVAQITYGVGLEPALRNMTQRVDCQDLKFLAVSIIIQRESGGNLAEILESIARLIRERFKLKGKIKALSAEGKMSAIILVAIPLAVAGLLFLLNPKYIRILASDSIGRLLVFVAVLMILFGIMVIRKIINIRV